MAVSLAASARRDEAIKQLVNLRADALADIHTLIPFSGAVLSLFSVCPEREDLRVMLLETVEALHAAYMTIYAQHAMLLHETVLRMLAIIFTWADLLDAALTWDLVNVLNVQLRDRQDATALTALSASQPRRATRLNCAVAWTTPSPSSSPSTATTP